MPADGSLIAALFVNGVIDEQVFSLCFIPEGGLLVIGGIQSSLHIQPIAWSPLMATHAFYTVTATALSIGGTRFDLAALSVTVDSGTTFTYLPRAAVTWVVAAIRATCAADAGCGNGSCRVYSNCYCRDVAVAESLLPVLSCPLFLRRWCYRGQL